MDIRQALVTDGEPAEPIDPGEGPLDNPAISAECLARFDPASGDAAADATLTQVSPTAPIIVALVRVDLVGSLTWSATWSFDRLDRLDQVFEENRVVDVRRSEPDREWDALPVDQEVPFRARFAAVGRVWTDRLVRSAPLFAGMLEASRLARDQSIVSAAPSRSRTARWSWCQTPACCHSRKRRQQVTPLPQPSSLGKYSHGRPVLRTNTIPVRAARFGMRGRPPLGLGSSGGSSGAMTSQSASLTNGLAMFCTHYRQSNRPAARFCKAL
jgi:hypothetical protein